MNLKFSVREIVESAMLIALALVLDIDGLKIPLSATGGSVSFLMIPLFLLALRSTPLKAFILIGIAFGIPDCLIDMYGFETYFLEYLIAYGSIALFSFVRNIVFDEKKPAKAVFFIILGVFLHTFIRLAAATVSSIINFGSEFMAAITYNAPYVLLSGAATLVGVLILYKPLLLINKKFPTKSI